MTKTEYREYLASPHWKELRKDFLEYENICNRCEMPRWLVNIAYDQDMHVHHRTYARLGAELDDDLEALCPRCHEVETFGRTTLRAPRSEPCVVCKHPAYNVYPQIYSDEPLCFTCSVVYDETLFHKLHLPLPVTDPADPPGLVWGAILETILLRIGVDGVLSKMADLDALHRKRLEEAQYLREHPEEVTF